MSGGGQAVAGLAPVECPLPVCAAECLTGDQASGVDLTMTAVGGEKVLAGGTRIGEEIVGR